MVMITRLTKQKGLDLVKAVFHEMMAEQIQMVVLGTGDLEFEEFFQRNGRSISRPSPGAYWF